MRRLKRRLRHCVAGVVGLGASCIQAGAPNEPPVCVTVPFEEPDPPAPKWVDLPPLSAASAIVDLTVTGYRDAVVSLPLGARSRRPIIVAAHGEGDRPEELCRFWRSVVGDRAFVLCPRGQPVQPDAATDDAGYFYSSQQDLGSEIDGAMAALTARFRQHADAAAPMLAGFAQGAILGAFLLPHHPVRFARAVLIEGGVGLYQEWNRAAGRRFRQRGGERVLFVCGQGECASAAEVSEASLRREGVLVQGVHVYGAGHTYEGVIGDEVARAFSWVVEGDERFAAKGP
jgi:predicted esterase